MVFANQNPNGKRGIFPVSAAGAGPLTGTAGATAFVQACKSLGNTPSAFSNILGNNAYATNPWYLSMVSYNHVGAPNSSHCQDTVGDAGFIATAGYVGPSGSSPATSNHPGGVNTAMADGSVKFLKDSISMQVYESLGTRGGGEVISSDSY